jgi:hypothetical protein
MFRMPTATENKDLLEELKRRLADEHARRYILSMKNGKNRMMPDRKLVSSGRTL